MDDNDMVQVAVFDPATGKIKQIVGCARQHMHEQHNAFPGHDWVEITGQHHAPHPNKHAIHPATKRLMVRPVDISERKACKLLELEQECRGVIHASLMDPAITDWHAFRAAALAKLENLRGAVDSATDAAGVAAICWG